MPGWLGKATTPALLAAVVWATSCGSGGRSDGRAAVTVRSAAGGSATPDVAVVNRRLAAAGLAKGRAKAKGGTLVVTGTGSVDSATVRRLTTDPGKLAFLPVVRQRPLPCAVGPSVLVEGNDVACYEVAPGIDAGVASAAAEFDRNTREWSVRIDFTDAGGAAFKNLAAQQVNKQVAIVLDGAIQSAPLVQPSLLDNFNNTAQITGNLTEAAAKQMASVLAGGPLPVPLTP